MLDASTAEFSLSHFADDVSRTQLETLIRQLKPKEIIQQKGNLSISTSRLLRNCLGIDCQWSALKEGKEFLRGEDAKDEVLKLFKAAKKGEEASDDDLVPEDIRKMYDKPLAMSALGGMIWLVTFPFYATLSAMTDPNFRILQVSSSAQSRFRASHGEQLQYLRSPLERESFGARWTNSRPHRGTSELPRGKRRNPLPTLESMYHTFRQASLQGVALCSFTRCSRNQRPVRDVLSLSSTVSAQLNLFRLLVSMPSKISCQTQTSRSRSTIWSGNCRISSVN